jgi:hypothetical protein
VLVLVVVLGSAGTGVAMATRVVVAAGVAAAAAAAAAVAAATPPPPVRDMTYDVVIYGATPAGCAAAMVAANNTGLRVALLEVSSRIGGMLVPGGIGLRDTDDFASAFGTGSFARRWVDLNGAAYGVPYVLQPDVVVGNASLWALLSSVSGGAIDVFPSTGLLEGPGAVAKAGAVVTSITTVDTAAEAAGAPLTGVTVWRAAQFIDASYDGDVAVAAGVSWTFGREARAQYNESLGGVQPFTHFQNFLTPVNPYNSTTGAVLPYIEAGALPPEGSADTAVMPFSYRACLTKNISNQVPFPQPAGYDPADFELLRRYVATFNATKWPTGPELGLLAGVYDYGGPVPYPRGGDGMKYDLCEGGGGDAGQTCPFTTDQPDINAGYVPGNRSVRAAVAARITYFVQGFLWTLAHDPGIPAGTRASTNSYGLCADAVPYWGPAAWPTQLYVREGVRIVGDYVATQVNVIRGECTPDAVASSAWPVDIHPMRRVAVPAGTGPYDAPSAMNEGQVGFVPFPGNGTVWEVRYPIMTPRRAEATNLLVPVCLSASHVVYGSIRVEPTFVAIGQAAGAAAVLAIRHGVAVQDVPIDELQALQRAYGVEPHFPPGRCPAT